MSGQTGYIGNAFSAGMLATSSTVTFTFLSKDEAAALARAEHWVSCVGHADTAGLISKQLGFEVAMARIGVTLHPGDRMMIAQYNGPRLPEGATELPEGASLRWILAVVAE